MDDRNVKNLGTPEGSAAGGAAENTADGVHSENAMKGLNAALDILKELGVESGTATAEYSETADTEEIITDGEGEPEEDSILAEEQTPVEEEVLETPEQDDDVKIFGAPTRTFKREEAATKDSIENESADEVGFSIFEQEPEPESEYAEDGEYEESEDASEDYIDTDTKQFDAPEVEASDDGEFAEEYTEEYTEDNAEEYTEENAEDDEEDSAEGSSGAAAARGSEEALKKLFNDRDDDDDDVKVKRVRKPRKPRPERKGFDASLFGFEEETDMGDKAAVAAASAVLDKRRANSIVSLVGSMICFLLVLYTEAAPVSGFLPHAARMSEASPAFYALIDLQLMLFGVMFLFDSLAKGLDRWIDHRVMTPAAVSLTVVGITAIHAIVTAFIGAPENLRLFCSLGSASLVMLALYDYLVVGADKRSFKMASLESTKFGATAISPDSSDGALFKGKLSADGACAINVTKGVTYKRFIERTSSLPECEKKLWIPALIVLGVSLLIGFISSIATKSIYSGISDAVLIYASSLPLNIFLVSSLPRHVAVKRGKDINATMIGHNAGDEYKHLSLVTFADTAVFLPRDTRVESRIIVDTERFCDVILTMVKIFRHVGGPIRGVFDRDLPNPDQEIPAQVKLISVSQSAIEVTVDGKPYTVASDKHLSAAGIKFRRQDGDERYSLLFLLENGRILAKFRIEYRVDERFERTARELDDVHISVGIKTVTPGINDAFLRTLRELDSCNFTVIRGSGEKDLPTTAPECDSSVIALGSVHKFLEMLLICENSVRRTRINSLIKYFSCGICLFMASWLIISNATLPVQFGLLIQVFWMIPVLFNSYLKR